jgi:hypothetical protein
MARILIAADPGSIISMERILGTAHELILATQFEDAVRILHDEHFDLITIGVHFDESRMFELMPQAKTHKNASTPIICFCTRDTEMTRIMHESIDVTTKVFGAWMYLDQHKYNVFKDPDAEIRRVIERCLSNDVRKANLAKRINIQAERERILQLRIALSKQEWSTTLEHKLGDLRQELAQVLLELSKLHESDVTQQHQIAISRALKDRVSESVDVNERRLTGKESAQTLTETNQSAQEQQVIQGEETKGREKRRKLNDDLRKGA